MNNEVKLKSNYQKELSLAIKIVKNSARITEWFRLRGYNSFTKKDNSPVTLADFAVQIYVISLLKENFGGDQVIAEENGTFLKETDENALEECFSELDISLSSNYRDLLNYRGKTSNRTWTIDPIDGTKGFMENLYYAIGMCFLINDQPQISAISIPDYDSAGLAIFIAEKNLGTKMSQDGKEFKSVHVSTQSVLENASLIHSLHFDKPWVIHFADAARVKKRTQADSMMKFCLVADGSYDLYLKPVDDHHCSIWDYAPGYLTIMEAGGKMTDLNGDPITFHDTKLISGTHGFLVSNSILHDKALEIFKKNQFNI